MNGSSGTFLAGLTYIYVRNDNIRWAEGLQTTLSSYQYYHDGCHFQSEASSGVDKKYNIHDLSRYSEVCYIINSIHVSTYVCMMCNVCIEYKMHITIYGT